MIYRRERPRCRKVLLELMKEYDCDLQELLHHRSVFLSHGLRVQAKKMIAEGGFHSAKELKDFEEWIMRYRSVELIK